MRRLLAALFLTLAVAPAPAYAGIPVTRPMTCPIGGERFDFTTTASYSTFGARADGKPFGSWTFPLAIPECPGNGLLLYKEQFEPAELARLQPLIESADYRALRQQQETPYYRMSWLLGRMGEPRDNVLWALIQATWEPADDSPVRMRYLGELASRVLQETGPPANRGGYALRAYGINALRELGRFEETEALLGRTPLEPLRPNGTLAGANENQKAYWLAYYEKQRTIIARRDRSVEPPEFPGRR